MCPEGIRKSQESFTVPVNVSHVNRHRHTEKVGKTRDKEAHRNADKQKHRRRKREREKKGGATNDKGRAQKNNFLRTVDHVKKEWKRVGRRGGWREREREMAVNAIFQVHTQKFRTDSRGVHCAPFARAF